MAAPVFLDTRPFPDHDAKKPLKTVFPEMIMSKALFTSLTLCAAAALFVLPPGCTNSTPAPPGPLPDDADFTFWLVETIIPESAERDALLSQWQDLSTDARTTIKSHRAIPNPSAPASAPPGNVLSAWQENTRKARALLSKARAFLNRQDATRRLTFTIGRSGEAPASSGESWELAVGEQAHVLLQVHNSAQHPLSVQLTGKSTDGFTLWPRMANLAPGERLFTRLTITAITSGRKESFITLTVNTRGGQKLTSTLPLTATFKEKIQPDAAIPADTCWCTFNTEYQGSVHPAAMIFESADPKAPPPRITLPPGQNPATPPACILTGERRTVVYTPGTLVLALPVGKYRVSAQYGALHYMPAEVLNCLPGEQVMVITLTEAYQTLAPSWHAGLLYPLQMPDRHPGEFIRFLRGANLTTGHLGLTGHAAGSDYPLNFFESFKSRACIAAKGVLYRHELWGGVLALAIMPQHAPLPTGAVKPGGTDWPDLVAQCEEIHRLGGKTISVPCGENLALPLAALLGKLDGLILDEKILPLWYDLLNCGLKLPPAGLMAQPDALGRTYVHQSGRFTYDGFLRNLRAGEVMVSTGTLIDFRVDGRRPGANINLPQGRPLRITASAWRNGESVSVNIIANGKVIQEGSKLEGGTLAIEWIPPASSWIAARAEGCHTGPVYVTLAQESIFSIASAQQLLGHLDQLDNRLHQAFFTTQSHRQVIQDNINQGRERLTALMNNPSTADPFYRKRQWMIGAQLEKRDITDKAVLAAMRKVPRHRFVPKQRRHESYADYAIPIGFGQTISQPYIVAFMTQALKLKGQEKVLEIGTGSGYQAAILAELAKSVFTIEIIEPLKVQADKLLRELNCRNVHLRYGNGYNGWPEEAPFDAIIVTAAPDHVPKALISQLAPGGRMIVPVGTYNQTLKLITKDKKGNIFRKNLLPVVFVPMTNSPDDK